MSIQERPPHSESQQHLNPAVAEWSLPEEGIEILLKLDNPGMEHLPSVAREAMVGVLGKVALLCETVVANQEALQLNGVALEGVFIYLAEYTSGLIPLMEMLADSDQQVAEDFPFQL